MAIDRKSVVDAIDQLLPLVIILLFVFGVYKTMTTMVKEQAKAAKQVEVEQHLNGMEQRLLQYMKEPEKWQKLKP